MYCIYVQYCSLESNVSRVDTAILQLAPLSQIWGHLRYNVCDHRHFPGFFGLPSILHSEHRDKVQRERAPPDTKIQYRRGGSPTKSGTYLIS
jgi:hypothetical protein